MSDRSKGQFWFVVRSLLGAVMLLGIVFLVPHAGQNEGRSFFEVARASVWGNYGEWASAWCSLKIILLGICAYLVLAGMDEYLLSIRRGSLSGEAFLTLMSIPLLLMMTGVFYLLKALF